MKKIIERNMVGELGEDSSEESRMLKKKAKTSE